MGDVPPPPGEASAANPGMTMEQLLQKERELALRAAELAKRDREVRLALQKMQPNWPRKCCCINPIVYHSIASEVPTDRVSFVTGCYYYYYFTIFMLIYNCVCAIVAFAVKDKPDATDDEKKVPFTFHFVASLFHLLGIPFAFFVWYFPVYQATSTFEAGKYKMAYIGLTVGFLYDVFMAVGVPGYGGCGIYFALQTRGKENDAPLWMGITCGILFIFQALYFLWAIFFRMRRYSRIDRNRTFADRAKNAIGSAIGVAIP